MGAKTGLLVFADQDVVAALRAATGSDRDKAAASVRRVHPAYTIESIEDGVLGAPSTHPTRPLTRRP
jgi:hypothetical protein